MKCPYCNSTHAIHAMHGKIKTFSCLHCGRGHKTAINGKTTTKKMIIDCWGLCDEISIQVDGRTVTLPAMTQEQRRECGQLVGGFA